MKNILSLILVGLIAFQATAQLEEQNRVITTGVPFLLIASDARSAGMGDIGVSTSADAFSQQWNAAKYAFALPKQGFGVTYTPYLSSLVNDIFLGNLSYFNRINERSAFGASIRYFSLGEIELRNTAEEIGLNVNPNEFAIDASYSLRLADQFSMGITGRYLSSDLRIPGTNGEDIGAAGTFAVDISGYYQSEEIPYNDFDGRWRAGFNISNIGPKISFDEVGQENNIPSNLAIGGGFDFILDQYNKVGISTQFNKLLVPTPQTGIDLNGDGLVDDSDQSIAINDLQNTSFFQGIFQSFGDAPDGFSEEIAEVTWALGAEYWYNDAFAFRLGYFNEDASKGARKFLTLGAGFKYTTINIDVSYLFSTSAVRSPLEGTLRFGLTFNINDNYYDEY